MARKALIEEKLTYSVIGAFYEVYNNLGYGHREHIYILALERELLARGHRVAREVWVPVIYKGEEIGLDRLDMLVDTRLIVEGKATKEFHTSWLACLYSYLKNTHLEIGLLLHFGPEAKFYRLLCETREKQSRKSV